MKEIKNNNMGDKTTIEVICNPRMVRILKGIAKKKKK